jgi:hypothetical protein
MDNRFASRQAKLGRVVFGRLFPGTDLMTGLLNICRGNDIKYGSIVAMIGSLAKARFIYAIPYERAKLGIKYSQPVEIDGPLEFIGGQGIIGVSDIGDTVIHLHGIVSDKSMKVYAGHFVDGGNPVLATIEVVIHELNEIKLVRGYDEETEFPLFKPY